jgi:hypothetical protein
MRLRNHRTPHRLWRIIPGPCRKAPKEAAVRRLLTVSRIHVMAASRIWKESTYADAVRRSLKNLTPRKNLGMLLHGLPVSLTTLRERLIFHQWRETANVRTGYTNPRSNMRAIIATTDSRTRMKPNDIRILSISVDIHGPARHLPA